MKEKLANNVHCVSLPSSLKGQGPPVLERQECLWGSQDLIQKGYWPLVVRSGVIS